MREIIFRGKRIDNGEWVYGWFCMYSFGQWPLKTSIIPSEKAHEGCFEHKEVEQSTIGQYTGLQDKNGKRIFEGDIVKVRQGNGRWEATICYENGSFLVAPISGNILERTLWEYWYNDWDIEVIGNMQDNPELLEVTT